MKAYRGGLSKGEMKNEVKKLAADRMSHGV